MTTLQKVTVFGTGVLGSQIIMQAAYHGKDVTAYDITDEVLAALLDLAHELADIADARTLDRFRTRDFRAFDLVPLTGPAARNKGMALFPRRIGGGPTVP